VQDAKLEAIAQAILPATSRRRIEGSETRELTHRARIRKGHCDFLALLDTSGRLQPNVLANKRQYHIAYIVTLVFCTYNRNWKSDALKDGLKRVSLPTETEMSE
jgi:hypothetical protein